MKRLGLIALLLTNASAYAVNPVQGWYGGILLGINYTPSTNFTFPTSFTPPPEIPIVIPTTVPISLNYKTMGQLAGQVGYRCGKFRGEGQLAYNNSPYSSLKINNVTLFAPSTSPYYSFEGSTNTLSGMVNGYYDFLPSAPDSSFAPFVGLGLGYAHTQNVIDLDFWYNNQQIRHVQIKRSGNSPAGQAMIGANFFMDDFAVFALDLRYFTTANKSTVSNARVEFLTVNLTFNGAFDFG